MKSNRIKQLLAEGKITSGSWVSLCSPIGAEIMGQMGFDWLLIDMEHGAGDYQTLLSQLQALSASETVPFVRVQSNDPAVIKRVLDLGAMGIMVTWIQSMEEAQQAVAACKYPPEGIRGVAMVRAARFGLDRDYLKEANGQIMTIIQMETVGAVESAEQILSLPGVDVAFVGPADLAANLGHTGDPAAKEVQDAIGKIEAAAKKHGVPLGSVSRTWAASQALIDKDYKLVSLGADISYMMKASQRALENFSKATGR